MKTLLISALAVVAAAPASAVVTVYQGDLAGFNAAAGNPAISIDFESLSGDIAGQTIAGVTLSNPDGNTLEVVNAADTFSPPGYGGPANVLPATSGVKVLSPGGTNLIQGPDIRQRDSLTLVFSAPLSAFGMDILFQSLDCCSFTNFQVFDGSNNAIAGGSVNAVGGGAGGAFFLGFTSGSANIARIVITEFDENDANPDSNIGYDTFRFGAINAVPEPASWALMVAGFGLAGAATRRRRVLATA
ncbi:PEPxxWA-CTERM sorting domain-containing protein [Sphingomonas sp. ID1715]|uniref:PEPxxWA-CTERM sorting domain-containing protein n=1 Tax=Sphingomonas sp. ID1715 TaxID=1656898 RepID=UPI001C2C836E|nr:PEPxxWA-CTERM sorting domain-containing protein [Sphingomonas sp. ID1715]